VVLAGEPPTCSIFTEKHEKLGIIITIDNLCSFDNQSLSTGTNSILFLYEMA
jgi:hypothetical protein